LEEEEKYTGVEIDYELLEKDRIKQLIPEESNYLSNPFENYEEELPSFNHLEFMQQYDTLIFESNPPKQSKNSSITLFSQNLKEPQSVSLLPP
jgi:hypothetical protein